MIDEKYKNILITSKLDVKKIVFNKVGKVVENEIGFLLTIIGIKTI